MRAPLEVIDAYAEAYVLASYLYYASDTESPWTDHEFDGCVSFLEYWRRKWPPEFRERIGDQDLKTLAHGLEWSDAEARAALVWAKSGRHWP